MSADRHTPNGDFSLVVRKHKARVILNYQIIYIAIFS